MSDDSSSVDLVVAGDEGSDIDIDIDIDSDNDNANEPILVSTLPNERDLYNEFHAFVKEHVLGASDTPFISTSSFKWLNYTVLLSEENSKYRQIMAKYEPSNIQLFNPVRELREKNILKENELAGFTEYYNLLMQLQRTNVFLRFFHGIYHLFNPLENLSEETLSELFGLAYDTLQDTGEEVMELDEFTIVHQAWFVIRARVRGDVYHRGFQKVLLIYGEKRLSVQRDDPVSTLALSMREAVYYASFYKGIKSLLTSWRPAKVHPIDMDLYLLIKETRETPHIEEDELRMRFVSMLRSLGWTHLSRMEVMHELAMSNSDSALSPSSKILFDYLGKSDVLIQQAWWFMRTRLTVAAFDQLMSKMGNAAVTDVSRGDILTPTERYPFTDETDDAMDEETDILSKNGSEIRYYSEFRHMFLAQNPLAAYLKPVDYNYGSNMSASDELRNFERTEVVIASLQTIWPYFFPDTPTPTRGGLITMMQVDYENALNARDDNVAGPITRPIEGSAYSLFDQVWLILRTRLTVVAIVRGMASMKRRRLIIKRQQQPGYVKQDRQKRLRGEDKSLDRYTILLTEYVSQGTFLPAIPLINALLANNKVRTTSWDSIFGALIRRDFPIPEKVSDRKIDTDQVVEVFGRMLIDPFHTSLLVGNEYFRQWLNAAVVDAIRTVETGYQQRLPVWIRHVYGMAYHAIVDMPPSLVEQSQLSWFYRVMANRVAYFFMLARYFGWNKVNVHTRYGYHVVTIDVAVNGKHNRITQHGSGMSTIETSRWFKQLEKLRDEPEWNNVNDFDAFSESLRGVHAYMSPDAIHFQHFVQDVFTRIDSRATFVFTMTGSGTTRYILPSGMTPNVLTMGLRYGLSAMMHHAPEELAFHIKAENVLTLSTDHVSAFYVIGKNKDVF